MTIEIYLKDKTKITVFNADYVDKLQHYLISNSIESFIIPKKNINYIRIN